MWGLKRIRGIFIIVLCVFIIGCQKDVMTEEPQSNISENEVVASVSENGGEADTSDVSEKSMTVISVLGKTEIAIENDRIHDKTDGVDHLNNLFTLDEINTILNTIKGTWEVDEYVGFISYDMCGRGRWLEDVDPYDRYEGDSGWEEYQEAQEWASNKIPDFTISIKEYETVLDGMMDVENNYIYVRTSKGVRYSSPMSIVLSMRFTDDDYPAFYNRTMAGIGSNANYPVIYIEFFTICDSGEDDTIFCNDRFIYEPATLVLSSDGQFMLLKDGAFYTLKKNIQSEILSGDFSCLENDDREEMESSYSRMIEDGHSTWRRTDLNGDGIEDLILQEQLLSDTISGRNPKRIIGIFACGEDSARCMFWDDNNDMEYRFCGTTGELMEYYDWEEEEVVSIEVFEHFYYDADWNKITDYKLQMCCITTSLDQEIPEEWAETHPDMTEDGYYYRYTETGNTETEVILTYEQMKEIYEDAMGIEFNSHHIYN